jgi:flagellar motility protein MotE (MotC chaperone)
MLATLHRIRFLPATILAATVLLLVKLTALWQEADAVVLNVFTVADAHAETTQPPQPTPPAPDTKAGRQNRPAPEANPADTEISSLSASEIAVLQQLAERRQALDAREDELQRKEALLQVVELRISERTEELKAMQANLERLTKVFDTQQDARVSSLVKIYEAMKPKDAARIFEALDIETLLLVAQRMNERKLSPIMAEMNPNRAKQVTEEIARLREISPANDKKFNISG